MAQTGYTPILIYSSTTASQAPAAGNLTNSTLGSELAINITDGKLFYKDNGGSVQVIAWKVTPTSAGGTGLTSYTAGDTLYYATGTTLSKLAIGASKTIMTSSGTAPQWSASLDTTQGGTGVTSYTAGDLPYYASGTTLSKLGIGASTTILTSSGTAPQWTAASSVAIGTATNLAGGAGGSVPYQSAASTTTFLGIGTANYVMTSSGSAPQWTAQSSLSVGTASNLLSNATTGVMQIVGPAASTTRVMTIPNANFTAARTDAAQTFTGDQTINGNILGGSGKSFIADSNRTYYKAVGWYDDGVQGNGAGCGAVGGLTMGPLDGSGAASDNTITLGNATYRWKTVYAGNGTINTSDLTTKQDIAPLEDAELRVAKRIKSLIKKFRFIDAVSQKGDAARIHVGVIAQEIQSAFTDEGLDANRYGLFCQDDWYEVDGVAVDENFKAYTAETPNAIKRTRLGIRYEQLVCFVLSAI